MPTELEILLDKAIDLCRSAGAIADRKGEQTNWEAFGNAAWTLIIQYRDATHPPEYRREFETWISDTLYFAHCEGETPVRDGSGYKDATVQGAWLAYSESHARMMPPHSFPGYSAIPAPPLAPLPGCPF